MTVAAPPVAAADPEQVVLPFNCAIEQGRIIVTPAPERAYRIIGPYHSHPFTACAPGKADRCRTWTIHRFDLTCGTTRVPWSHIVAAAHERTSRRAWLEGGRLHVRLGPLWRPLLGDGRGGLGPPSIAMPAGFAPPLGIGARFTGGAQTSPTVVDAGRPRPAAVPQRPPDAAVQSPRKDAGSNPEAATSDAAAPPASAVSEWSTTTSRSSLFGDLSTFNPLRVVGFMALLAAAWLAFSLARRQIFPAAHAGAFEAVAPPASRPDIPPPAPVADPAAAERCSELIAKAVNLHRAVREAIAEVAAGSLRDVLTADLAKVQAALLSSELTDLVATETWAPVEATVAGALADLDRIHRLASGIADSSQIASATRAAAIPTTVPEAFEILGVNPDASRTIVKKIVDGLRQSWHPDHARDEADRRLREDRMKQINIAWDIISGRRQEA